MLLLVLLRSLLRSRKEFDTVKLIREREREVTQQPKRSHTGGAIFYFFALIYIGLLVLFCWQTAIFVNWLFPDDQVMMKILLVFCFDGMAFFYAVADLFYHFASKNTRGIVRWGWGISFFLSLLASVLYLIINSFFRFHLVIDSTWINVGYAVTIVAVVFQVCMVTFFLYIEWLTRHPYQDEYLPALPERTATGPFTEEERRRIQEWINEPVALAQTATMQPLKKKRARRPVTDQLPDDQAVSSVPQK